MANQYDVDPRQAIFLQYYIDPKSETFSNAYQSAIKAGYSDEYAQNITSLMPSWLSDSIGDEYKLSAAEANLVEFLLMDTKQQAMSMFGPLMDKEGKPIFKENTNIMKIKADVTKFVLERLNKQKYAARSELTGPEGKELNVSDTQTLETLLKTAQAVMQNATTGDTTPSETSKTPEDFNKPAGS